MTNRKQPNTHPIKADVVAFDYGNTLVIDPFEAVLDSILPAVYDLLMGIEEVKTQLSHLQPADIRAAWLTANTTVGYQFISHVHQEEPIIQQALVMLGVPASVRATTGPLFLARYRQALKFLLGQNKKLQVTLLNMFERFKKEGKKIAVLSNDRSYGVGSTFRWLGVDHLVDVILSSEEVGIEKPDPKIFQLLAERFDTALEKIVYIGDDVVRDIEGGHNAGVKTIWYNPPRKQKKGGWYDYTQKPKIQPDATITDLYEITSLIV